MTLKDLTLSEFKSIWEYKHRLTQSLATIIIILAFSSFIFKKTSLLVFVLSIGCTTIIAYRDTVNYKNAQEWEHQDRAEQIYLLEIIKGFFSIPGMTRLYDLLNRDIE